VASPDMLCSAVNEGFKVQTMPYPPGGGTYGLVA
jgi:hypothetical protein